MTALALHTDMPARQRKPGQVVIKPGDAPGPITVTLLTLCARLSLMLVIFPVAGVAIQRRIPETLQVLVARNALDSGQRMRIS